MHSVNPQVSLSVEDLRFKSPEFSEAELEDIAEDIFAITGQLKALGGERDQNVRITDSEGQRYVLKISGVKEAPEVVDFQVKALLHIAQHDAMLPVPRLVPGRNGDLVHRVEREQEVFQVRMMTYLSGIPYEDGPSPSLEGLQNIGVFLARLNRALLGFSHPAANHFMPWDITNGLIFNQQLQSLLSGEIRQIVEPLLDHIEAQVYPKLKSLRAQVIHQDGHGGNLLRQSAHCEEITGLIDFGDMVYGPLINDLAVSTSHFLERGTDVHAIAAAMCRGFHSVTPLAAEETDLLLDLVIARQILTLQLFEFRRLNVPDSPLFVIEDQPVIQASIRRLAALDRAAFCRDLRKTCRNP